MSRQHGEHASAAGRAFARFAATRDGRAFAIAFDATAQDLLLIGTRLAGERARAEDLLQQTWCHALRKADEFDPDRPLLPWLIGILVREARRAHRDRLRRERREAVAMPDDRIDSPLDAAARAEFVADCERALAQLDSTHRQVLVLRLVHGLTSTQIAHSLGRSPETVRSQLARGLKRLRRRLPAGHALAGLAAADLGPASLRALRARLMADPALGVASATPLSIAVGLITMSKLAVATAVVAVLAVAWLASRPSSVPDRPLPRTSAAAEHERVSSAGSRAPAAANPGPSTAPRVPVPTPRPTAALVGRCVDGDGRPLAGATVSLVLLGNPDPNRLAEAELREGPFEWLQPDPIATGTDGTFRFGFAPLPVHKYQIRSEKAGHALAYLWSEELEPGSAQDVGDLRMPRGCLVHGVVRDRDGAPVARLRVGVTPQRGTTPWPFAATTADDGSFTLPSPVPPGHYEVWSSSIGLEPQHLDVAATGEQLVDLRFDRPGIADTIEGVVVDPSGLPLAGVRVEADPMSSHLVTRSRADGSFRFVRRADEPDAPVRLAVSLFDLDYVEVAHPDPIAWGTHDVLFAVNTGETIEVRVVDGASGRPVERFGVRLVPVDGAGVGHDSSRRLRSVGDHHGGRCTVGPALPGTYMLSVEAAGRRFAPSPYQRVEVEDGNAQALTVVLWPPAAVVVDVSAGGAPKAGSQVELLIVTGGTEGQEPRGVRERTMPYFGDGRSRQGTLLAVATTDAGGRAVLAAPRGGPFAIRITGDHRPLYREEIHIDGDVRLPFVVEHAASVLMRVQPWPLPGDGPTALIVGPTTAEPVDWRSGARPVQVGPIGDDGSVRIDGLAPGSWRVRLSLGTGVDPRVWLRWFDVDVADLQSGELREVPCDLSPWVLTELTLRGLVNGAPAAGATVVLWLGEDLYRTDARLLVHLDDDGRATVGIPHGRFRGQVSFPDGGASFPLEPIDVGDEPLERTIDLTTGSVDVVLRTPDDRTPLGDVELWFDTAQGRPSTARTDVRGRASLGTVPTGVLRVWMWPRELADKATRRRMSTQPGDLDARRLRFDPIRVAPGRQLVELVAPSGSGY